MAETLAELDARLEQLALEQAHAVEHRNWARDAELSLAIDRLKRRRSLLELDDVIEKSEQAMRGKVASVKWAAMVRELKSARAALAELVAEDGHA